MENKKDIYGLLPTGIKSVLAHTSSAFLVGSAVYKLMAGELVRDYDIIVEDKQDFMTTLKFLERCHDGYQLNTLGGIKFSTPDGDVDIWCQSVGDFIRVASKITAIYH